MSLKTNALMECGESSFVSPWLMLLVLLFVVTIAADAAVGAFVIFRKMNTL